MTSDKDPPQLNCCAWFKYCKLAQIRRAYFAVRQKYNISDVIKKETKFFHNSSTTPSAQRSCSNYRLQKLTKWMCHYCIKKIKIKMKNKEVCKGVIWQYVQLRTRLTVDGASLHQHQQAAKPHRAPVFISSAQYKCSQIPSTPPSKSNCSTILWDKLWITAAVHVVEPFQPQRTQAPVRKPRLFPSPASTMGQETACKWHGVIIICCNKQTALFTPSIPSPRLFTRLHYTNKAKPTSGWCRHGPGGACQEGEINGRHQRAAAAHEPPRHWPLEIKLILLNFFFFMT